MSTSWDVVCRDCNVNLGLSDNRQPDACDRVAAAAADLAEIGAKFPGAKIDCGTFDFWSDRMSPIPVAWFVAHAGHAIVARSEYGQIYNTCGESFQCKNCRHHLCCAKDKGHDGDHEEDKR